MPVADRPSQLGAHVNNREIASFVLLSAVFIWGVTKDQVRNALVHLIRAFLDRRILVVTGVYAACIILTVLIALAFGLWNQGLVIETAIWFVAVGFPLVLSVPNAAKDRRYYRNAARSIFEIGAIFVFFVNLRTFSIAWEIVLQLLLVMLVGMLVVTEHDQQHERIRPALTVILSGVLLLLAVNTLVQLYGQRHSLDWHQTLLSFLLTIWLPLVTIGFLVPLAYVVEYESAFNWMRMGSLKQPPSLRDKLALIAALNLHLRDIHEFRPYWGTKVKQANTFREKVREVRAFRHHLRQKEDEAQCEELLLRQYTGVAGKDDQGKQLDRREFKETTDALRWIAVCQMGHFRKRSGTYNPDIMVTLSDLTRHGLPEEHGVTVRVSDDGKAWYGWRETATGWVFAIGAASGPPDQWLYDGPQPPSDFPSEEAGWEHFVRGKAAPNW